MPLPRSRSVAVPRLRPCASVLCLVALTAVSLSGCVRVAPYERGTLARRDMQLGGHAGLSAGEEHAQAYREGSVGGGEAKGGGCGCN